MQGRDTIHLRGLEFYAYHGVLAEEQKLGQRFIIDTDLFLDLRKAGQSDCVEDTVSYAEVYQTIKATVTGAKYQLLEALAERIAQEILTGYPCQGVRVEVHKPQAPIPGIFRDASIEVWRERE